MTEFTRAHLNWMVWQAVHNKFNEKTNTFSTISSNTMHPDRAVTRLRVMSAEGDPDQYWKITIEKYDDSLSLE